MNTDWWLYYVSCWMVVSDHQCCGFCRLNTSGTRTLFYPCKYGCLSVWLPSFLPAFPQQLHIWLCTFLSTSLTALWMPSFPWGSLALFLSCSSFCLKCPPSTQLHPLCCFLTHGHSSFKAQPKASPTDCGLRSLSTPITLSRDVPPQVPHSLYLYQNDSLLSLLPV